MVTLDNSNEKLTSILHISEKIEEKETLPN